MHSCSLDSKIRMTLEAQVVEKTVEVNKTERKRPAASAASKAAKRAKEDLPPKGKRKRSPTAFFLFMYVPAFPSVISKWNSLAFGGT
jgi:high mobility group protein B3